MQEQQQPRMQPRVTILPGSKKNSTIYVYMGYILHEHSGTTITPNPTKVLRCKHRHQNCEIIVRIRQNTVDEVLDPDSYFNPDLNDRAKYHRCPDLPDNFIVGKHELKVYLRKKASECGTKISTLFHEAVQAGGRYVFVYLYLNFLLNTNNV